MLTGVMLLQVCTASSFQYYRQRSTSHSLQPVTDRQAGRYYAKRPSSSRPEAEATVPNPQSPPTEPIRRSGTPFRELTEEEAFELEALNEL